MSLSAAAKARKQGGEEQPLPHMDDATVRRARKVWHLAIHGQPRGERSAGQARMEELAARHGMTVGALMVACGIAKPRVRVKAGSLWPLAR